MILKAKNQYLVLDADAPHHWRQLKSALPVLFIKENITRLVLANHRQ